MKKRKCLSEEHKLKISETKKSRHLHLSEEHKRKVSESQKGHKVSLETRRKMSESRKGQNHYNWQGGKSSEKYSLDFSKELSFALKVPLALKVGFLHFKSKIASCKAGDEKK